MAKKGLQALSTVQLQGEIKRREAAATRRLKSLRKRREKLLIDLAAIDREMRSLASAARQNGLGGRSGIGRTRPKNDSNLAEALAVLLTEKVLSVTEIAEQVQMAGYKTTSPNFRIIVNQTLIKDKRFKRVRRGHYTAK